MFEPIFRIADKHSNWKSILVIFALFLVLKLLFDFHVVPMVEHKTGGYPAPDINFSTSPETVKLFITESHPEGLKYYRNVFFVLDIFFPLFLCGFLALALNSLAGKLLPKFTLRKWIIFLPLTGMVFDYVESVGVVILIFSPEYLTLLAPIVAAAFKLKFLFGLSSLFLVVIGTIVLGMKSVIRRLGS
ncbi:MAG: hypothetical protein KUG72_09540 [Pseudomonadales bacterium]|nr:hypothetical protein [Pseudomonadales bacterium]